MRYTTYDVCSGKECMELVPVKNFNSQEGVYCEKCAKKYAKAIKAKLKKKK